MKIKIGILNDRDILHIKEINIKKAQACIAAYPFATVTYIALKTKLSIKFILDNRKVIGV